MRTEENWNGGNHIKVSNTDLKVTQEDWDRIFPPEYDPYPTIKSGKNNAIHTQNVPKNENPDLDQQ